MADCVNTDSLRENSQNENNHNGVLNNQPNGPGWYNHLDAQGQAQIQDAVNTRNAYADSINNATSDQNPMPPSGTVSPSARSAGKLFTAQTAKDAIVGAAQRLTDIYNQIIGTNSVGKTNLGLRIANQLSYIFKNTQARIETFMLLDAPQEGRNVGSNIAVQALRGVDRKIIGYMRDFNSQYFTPFLQKIEADAHNLGFSDATEFARVIGDYQVMAHMPEANAYWVETNHRAAEALRLDGKEKEAAKIETQVAKFLQYKDEVTQTTANGTGIVCAGRTDGYARAWIDTFHQMYGIDRATMESYGQELTNIVEQLNKWNIEQGNVDSTTVEAMTRNTFQKYVPLKAISDLSKGLPTDSTILNAGNFHAREGMDCRTPIANAFDSIHNHAQRIAMDNACRDLGFVFKSMQLNAIRQGRATPIQIESYNTVAAKAQAGGSFGRMYRSILEGDNGFMMTFMDVQKGADGALHTERKIVTFDDRYIDEAQHIRGRDLNEAMQSVQQNAIFRAMGSVTGALSGLNTHYNVAFPVINSIKDAGERLSNLFGQSYRLENGSVLDGDTFALSYVASLPKVAAFLPKVIMGKVRDLESSEIGRLWKEYVNQGVKQEFDPTWHKEGQELSAVMQELRKGNNSVQFLSVLKTFDDSTRQKILNGFHKWNDYFNNIASFAQYYALRKNGVTIDSAATGTMEVINLRESGRATEAMRAIWAFAKPTMQGAASLLRAVGLSPNASGRFQLSPKGIAYCLGTGLAVSTMWSIFKSAVGEEQADNISIDDAARYIFFPIDKEGNTVKFPIPFGVTSLAAGSTIAVDRLLRGKLEPLDFVSTMIRQLFKATTPNEYPAYAMSDGALTFLGSVFTPSALMPLYSVATNKGYHGQPLTYGDSDSTTPMHMQGKTGTPTGWTTFAKMLYDYSGGIFNVAPEQVKTAVEGYAGGILRIIPDMISRNSLASMGFDESTQGILGPTMSVLGMSMTYRKIPMTHTAQFYAEYNKLKREIRGLNVKLPEAGAYSDAEDRAANWRNKLIEAGLDEEKINRYLALYQAEQDKMKLTKQLKADTVDNPAFPEMSHEEIQEIFNTYIDECETLYLKALDTI